MPCKGCNSTISGKTQCVVSSCGAKWCNSCVNKYAQKRNSGWKCNSCVGIPSNQTSTKTTYNYMENEKQKFIAKHNLQFYSEHERNRILREEGFF